MKMWLITQWGNPGCEEGANGPDTNCFVSAETFDRALELGTEYISKRNGSWRSGHMDKVTLLGDNDLIQEEKAYWDFFMYAFGLGGTLSWVWNEFENKWEK